MAVENWIDTLCKVWAVSDGKRGQVKSYSVFEKAEFPEALTVYPCALSYTTEVSNSYSMGGPCIDLWKGVTEFHITSGVGKHLYPEVMRYFARIRNAVANAMTLGGKVTYFQLDIEQSIRGPVMLKYGDEAEHLGLIVRWIVKEDVTGDFTIAR